MCRKKVACKTLTDHLECEDEVTCEFVVNKCQAKGTVEKVGGDGGEGRMSECQVEKVGDECQDECQGNRREREAIDAVLSQAQIAGIDAVLSHTIKLRYMVALLAVVDAYDKYPKSQQMSADARKESKKIVKELVHAPEEVAKLFMTREQIEHERSHKSKKRQKSEEDDAAEAAGVVQVGRARRPRGWCR